MVYYGPPVSPLLPRINNRNSYGVGNCLPSTGTVPGTAYSCSTVQYTAPPVAMSVPLIRFERPGDVGSEEANWDNTS
jgi:hypothetical protein